MFHMPIDLQGREIAGPVHRECESVVPGLQALSSS
jgi:hypothetical protein